MAKTRKPQDATFRNTRAAQRKITALDNRLKRIEWRVTMIEATVGIDPWRPPKKKATR